MAIQNNLTKFQDAVTIVTANFLNKAFGGLFGSAEATNLDPSDPLVAGHVHDGQHLDGHAQKINLVTHVTGQITHSNLADNAVRNRNVARFVDQSQAIPEYVIDGSTTYYKLDLSAVRASITDAGSVFVFRPGVTPNADNVYDDFSDLYDVLSARQGIKILQFDDSSAAITIPAGSYDFSNTIFSGTPSQNNFDLTTVTIPSGVDITVLPDIIMNRLLLDITSTTLSISNITTDKYLLLESSNIQCSGTKALLTIISGTSPTFTLFLSGISVVQNMGSAVFVFTGTALGAGTMDVYGADSGVLGNNTVRDNTTAGPGNATLNLYYLSSGADLSETHAVSPTINKILLPDADKTAYDNTSSGLTATDVQSAIDEIDTTLDNHGLPEVLTIDNATGGTNLRISSGDNIVGEVSINLVANTPSSSNPGGNIVLTAGDGFNDEGGVITLQAGDGEASGTGSAGGDVTITAGDGDAPFLFGAAGGNVVITAGNGDGTGNGGDIILNPGTGSPAGEVTVNGDATITGKLTVVGLIDPTGLVLDEQTDTPGGTPVAGKFTLWLKQTNNQMIFTNDSADKFKVVTNDATTLVVSQSGGDYSDIFDAFDFVASPSGSDVTNVLIGSGSYVINDTLSIRDDVNYLGSGSGTTTLTQTNGAIPFFDDSGMTTGTSSLSGLSLIGGDTGLTSTSAGTILLDQIIWEGQTTGTIDNFGTGTIKLTDNYIDASSATTSYGVKTYAGGTTVLTDTTIENTSGTLTNGILTTAGSTVIATNTEILNTSASTMTTAVEISGDSVAYFSGGTISATSGAITTGIKTAGSLTTVEVSDTLISNASGGTMTTAFFADTGSTATIINTAVENTSGTLTTGILATGGSTATFSSGSITNAGGTTMTTAVSTTTAAAVSMNDSTIINTSGTITTAISAESGSTLTSTENKVLNSGGTAITTGFYNDSSTVKTSGTNTITSTGTAFYATDNASTYYTGMGPTVETSTTSDITFENGNTSVARMHFNAGRWDDTKVSGTPDGFKSVNNGLQTGRESYNIVTDFDVGRAVRGKRTHLGQGRPSAEFLKVLTNTNDEAGTWADLSSTLADPSSGIETLFPGVGVNNALYVGGTQMAFSGFTIQITTAMVLGAGSVDVQYWDGVAWTSTTHSTQKGGPNYTRYRNVFFTPSATPEVLEFRLNSPEIYNNIATKVLNGITAYWVRFIITGGITTAPDAQFIFLHGNSAKITTDGTIQYLSRARMLRRVDVNINTPDATTPATITDTAISANVSISEYNTHPDGSVTSVLGEYLIQSEDDTATSIVPVVRWKPTTAGAGNVVWSVTAVPIIMTGATPDTEGALTEQTSSRAAAAPGVANEIKSTSFDPVDISTLGPGDKVIFKVERLGAAGGDTYAADAIRRSFHLDIYKAYEGEFA